MSAGVLKVTKNVAYARPVPGPKKGLRLDIYARDVTNNTGTQARPAVLVVHGGSSLFCTTVL